MSHEDRRNIRLVCKRFFDIPIHQKFLHTEQFTCSSSIYPVEKFLTTLQRNKREVFQLKFRHTKFHRNTVRLFETMSFKIQTLNFFSCSFEESVLEKILIMCSSLKQLTFTSIYYQRLLVLFDYLERKNVIKSDVIFLEIDWDKTRGLCFHGNTREGKISGNVATVVERIIGIFPNLQYLKIDIMFLKNEITSILHGIKELGLSVLDPLSRDDYADTILSLTKYGRIYSFCVPSK